MKFPLVSLLLLYTLKMTHTLASQLKKNSKTIPMQNKKKTTKRMMSKIKKATKKFVKDIKKGKIASHRTYVELEKYRAISHLISKKRLREFFRKYPELDYEIQENHTEFDSSTSLILTVRGADFDNYSSTLSGWSSSSSSSSSSYSSSY